MPFGVCSDSGSTQPYWFLEASVIFFAASANSVRFVGMLVDAGGLGEIEVDEDRVDEGGEREHYALAVDLDDVGDLAPVVFRRRPSASSMRGDRALLGEPVDPGAVEADHVAQRARGGADDDLVARGGIGTADQRDLDAGVLALSKSSMMPRRAPAGISGSHHWMNSMVVSANADVAQSAHTATAARIVTPNFLIFICASQRLSVNRSSSRS